MSDGGTPTPRTLYYSGPCTCCGEFTRQRIPNTPQGRIVLEAMREWREAFFVRLAVDQEMALFRERMATWNA